MALLGCGESTSYVEPTREEPPATEPPPETTPTEDAEPAPRPLPTGCAPAPRAGHQTITCDDGTTFDVEASTTCARGGCGIILDVHGWSMNGPMEDRHTRMRELATPRGYVVVQPTAPGRPPSWTRGQPTGRDFAWDDTVWSFLQATLQVFDIDPDRVHMTGFSQGAQMTFRFMFRQPELFASIAPIAGPDGFAIPNLIGKVSKTGEAPRVPVPILYTHGTKDRMLTHDEVVPSLTEEITRAYGLSTSEPIESGPAYRAQRWAKDGRVMFELWVHDFEQKNFYVAGHCVPGPVNEGDGAFLRSDTPFRCVDEGQFDFGKQILRFFEEHPRGR